MAYAIMRFEKHKDLTSITESFRHMMRTKHCPSANPKLRHHNRVIHGSMNPRQDFQNKLDQVSSIQKNAVLGVEFLLTCSPEWWAAADQNEQNEWLKKSCNFLAKEFGKANLVHIQLHEDERTPHLTGMIIPTVEKYQKTKNQTDIKLAAARWFDGADKMTALQDKYHAKVKHLGLERGAKGSTAEHQRPNEYLKELQDQKIAEHTVKKLSLGVAERAKILMNGSQFLEEINQEIEEQNDRVQFLAKAQKMSEKKAEKAIKKNGKLKRELDAIKDHNKLITDTVRQLPLSVVAEKLGLVRGKTINDETLFHSDDHKIYIKDDLVFKDFKTGQGAKGAIDLVVNVMGVDFKDARLWLIDNFGIEDGLTHIYSKEINDIEAMKQELDAKKAEVLKEVKSFHKEAVKREQNPKVGILNAPERENSNLKYVEDYLSKRKISQITIKDVIKKGLVYADKMRNAVFHHNTYCEKVGTGKKPFKGSAAGSNKNMNAWRYTPKNDDRKHERLVICESPVDAMSYKDLFGGHGTFAATGGAAARLADNLRNAAWQEIVIAFDNDKTGLEMAARLEKDLKAAGYTNIRIHSPEKPSKDWNEALQNGTVQFQTTGETSFLKDTFGSPKP